MTVPLLPESAPFNPAQRAWLNGFFAGLLGIGSEGGGIGTGAGAASLALAPAAAQSHAEAEAEEETPWHDPALPLEERLELAEGRPYDRKLMAAMAQLDCGACGYLCETYSQAIASGEEKDLKRCTPGGKETARKLKELVAAHGSVTTNGAVMTSVVSGDGPTTSTMSGSAMTSVVATPAFHRSNPFPAKLIASQPLNRDGSQKETRHIMLDLAGSGLVYKPGDALGVFPENCPDLVEEILHELGADDRLDLRSALLRECSLGRPSDDLIERLVECATDPDEADHLARLRDGEDDWIDTADLLDVLLRHPSARMEVEPLAAMLPRLQPRLYSISSS
ncbi:MAG: (Fe-S)-binding protein, partial [Singulisphaera sp.]